MSPTIEEILYPALEDYELDIVIGQGPSARSVKVPLQKFTLIGATTRAGLLTSPLRSRFGIVHRLEFYTPADLEEIVRRSARILNVAIDDAAARELALRSRGTPRIANRLLRRARVRLFRPGGAAEGFDAVVIARQPRGRGARAVRHRGEVRATAIASLATYVPPKVLTNADLERIVDTTDDWIVQRTGIHERHIVDPGVGASDLGREAAIQAIARAGLTPDDIGVIVVGTVTPDMLFPSTACLIQHKIGAHHAWGFDLSAACSGFTFALATASQFVATGAHDHALVIGADVMSSIIDYEDRATCVIFGDGAGAVVVSAAAGGGDGRIIDFEHEIDGSGGPASDMAAGGS